MFHGVCETFAPIWVVFQFEIDYANTIMDKMGKM